MRAVLSTLIALAVISCIAWPAQKPAIFLEAGMGKQIEVPPKIFRGFWEPKRTIVLKGEGFFSLFSCNSPVEVKALRHSIRLAKGEPFVMFVKKERVLFLEPPLGEASCEFPVRVEVINTKAFPTTVTVGLFAKRPCATLEVSTIPEEAEILINDEPAGTGKVALTLWPGIYEISARLEGVSTSKRVFLEPFAHKTETLNLEEKAVLVSISSNPPGATVLLDGKPVGKTPITLRTFPGEHVISVSKRGFTEKVERIQASFGDTISLSVKLKPIPSWIAIDSAPQGAYVFLNGRLFGKTPTVLGPLLPGTYTLRVEKEGYEAQTLRVTVFGAAKKVFVRMRREGEIPIQIEGFFVLPFAFSKSGVVYIPYRWELSREATLEIIATRNGNIIWHRKVYGKTGKGEIPLQFEEGKVAFIARAGESEERREVYVEPAWYLEKAVFGLAIFMAVVIAGILTAVQE